MVNLVGATNGTSSVQGVSSDLSSTSVQMAFAILQMELAKTHKDSAMGRIEQIRKSQSDMQSLNEVKNALKVLQNYGKKVDTSKSVDDPNLSNEDKDALKAYQLVTTKTIKNECGQDIPVMDFVGFNFENGDSSEKINVYIGQIDSKVESVGSDQQTLMVLIQEDMGQYNSYTQGASAQVSKFSDVLSTLAQSR